MKNLFRFLKKYKILFILAFFIIFIIYFFYFNNIISIDTELYINNKQEMLRSWIAIDRWSLVILKLFLLKLPFNIIITRIFTVFLFFISSIIYTYLFTKWIKFYDKKIILLILLALTTSPIFAEQFGFSLQCLEMSLGILLFSINLLCIDFYITNNKKIYFIISVILTTFCFGLYQSFVLLFISFSIFYVLTHDYKSLYKLILLFFISFILFSVIGYLFKNYIYNVNSNYLNSNFKWGQYSIVKNILRIGYFGVITLIGKSYFHSISFLIFFIIGVFYLIKIKKFKECLLFICLGLSPFILIIFTANNIAYRSQFSYVFVLIFLFLYILQYNKFRKILTAFLLLFIIKNMIFTPTLLYSDYIRYKSDLGIAKKLSKTINKNKDKNIELVLIYSNNKIIKGETLGCSFVGWDGNNKRVYEFFKTQNIDINSITKLDEKTH